MCSNWFKRELEGENVKQRQMATATTATMINNNKIKLFALRTRQDFVSECACVRSNNKSQFNKLKNRAECLPKSTTYEHIHETKTILNQLGRAKGNKTATQRKAEQSNQIRLDELLCKFI